MEINLKTDFNVGDKVYYIRTEPYSDICAHCKNGRIHKLKDPEIVEGIVSDIILLGENDSFGHNTRLTKPVSLSILVDGLYVGSNKVFVDKAEAKANINNKEYWNEW